MEPATGDRIASVNGRSISRQRIVNLLLESHGAGILDQLIGLETAQIHAAANGVTITKADIDKEYKRTLRLLADPLASVTPGAVDRDSAERLLDTVLAKRNLSRVEFDLVICRNAVLRKSVESKLVLNETSLQREYELLYGSRVEIRHIQLATLREVERVKALLHAGEDFGEVARHHSVNQPSARDGGRLDPFSAADERIPALLRQTAFSLAPGERSDALRVGEWYHIIQVDRFLPARQRSFPEVREEVEMSLRDRLAETAIFKLFDKLFREATIDIHDPFLKAAFEKRHPDLSPS